MISLFHKFHAPSEKRVPMDLTNIYRPGEESELFGHALPSLSTFTEQLADAHPEDFRLNNYDDEVDVLLSQLHAIDDEDEDQHYSAEQLDMLYPQQNVLSDEAVASTTSAPAKTHATSSTVGLSLLATRPPYLATMTLPSLPLASFGDLLSQANQVLLASLESRAATVGMSLSGPADQRPRVFSSTTEPTTSIEDDSSRSGTPRRRASSFSNARCTVCNKMFPCHSKVCALVNNQIAISSYQMVRHMVVHTKDKPFPCTICARGFTQASSLRIHAETFHPGEEIVIRGKTVKVKSSDV